jgi:cathepsin A (carboxypeptidase C)
MRVATQTLLLGATTAAFAQEQKVLSSNFGGVAQEPLEHVLDAVKHPLEHLTEAFGEMPAGAKGLWDEMSLLVPGFLEKAGSLVPRPQPHTRKPDSEWDYIVKGADVQSAWVETNGVKHRKLDGPLEAYDLRAKSVDPSSLGLDKVKQYSGYLDDNENDKHLFYCELKNSLTLCYTIR